MAPRSSAGVIGFLFIRSIYFFSGPLAGVEESRCRGGLVLVAGALFFFFGGILLFRSDFGGSAADRLLEIAGRSVGLSITDVEAPTPFEFFDLAGNRFDDAPSGNGLGFGFGS